nr:hypothetical protein [Halomonas socia]
MSVNLWCVGVKFPDAPDAAGGDPDSPALAGGAQPPALAQRRTVQCVTPSSSAASS